MKCFVKRRGAGFTLVELIIVIVILGILAAVAVPAYSGYVSKADEAADLQLIAATNTAFAAACAEMGIEPTAISASASLDGADGAKKLKSVNAKNAESADIAGFNDAFLRYFGDNQDRAFKVYTKLNYDQPNGIFKGEGGAAGGQKSVTAMIGSVAKTFSVSNEDLAAWDGTTFDAVGTTGLTNAIDNLTQKVLPFAGLLNNPEFDTFFNGLGLDTSSMNAEELAKAKANALVLWSASASGNLNSAEVLQKLAKGEGIGDIKSAGSAEDIAAMSMEYAMMMAYANSEYGSGLTGIELTKASTTSVTLSELPAGYSSIQEYVNKLYPGATYIDNSSDLQDALAEAEEDEYEEIKAYYAEQGLYTIYQTTPATYMSINDYFNEVSGHLMETTTKTTLKTDGTTEDTTGFVDEYTFSTLYDTITKTDGWSQYMANQGSADLAAYAAAMSMVNGNVGNLGTDGVAQLLTNGYTDKDFNAMLQTMLGS